MSIRSSAATMTFAPQKITVSSRITFQQWLRRLRGQILGIAHGAGRGNFRVHICFCVLRYRFWLHRPKANAENMKLPRILRRILAQIVCGTNAREFR